MFQGTVSRLSVKAITSAAEISADADVLVLSGTTEITDILPRVSGVGSQMVWLVPTGGAISLAASGNIAAAETAPDLKATPLIYVQSTGKWYPVSAA